MGQVEQPATMADLTGRVVVVTGGASGIGLGMAQSFLAEGADPSGHRSAFMDDMSPT